MRSKTLISYQKGYCGQPADIEAMKPREARAYCLGVGHVAAGTLPFGSGAEVLAALTTRRRDVGLGGSEDDETAMATTFPLTLESEGRNKIDCVRALRDVAYGLNISRELHFIVNIVRNLPHTFYCVSDAERNLAVQALRASGATVTIPTSKDSPR
jgi:hypothetical protein